MWISRNPRKSKIRESSFWLFWPKKLFFVPECKNGVCHRVFRPKLPTGWCFYSDFIIQGTNFGLQKISGQKIQHRPFFSRSSLQPPPNQKSFRIILIQVKYHRFGHFHFFGLSDFGPPLHEQSLKDNNNVKKKVRVPVLCYEVFQQPRLSDYLCSRTKMFERDF